MTRRLERRINEAKRLYTETYGDVEQAFNLNTFLMIFNDVVETEVWPEAFKQCKEETFSIDPKVLNSISEELNKLARYLSGSSKSLFSVSDQLATTIKNELIRMTSEEE